MSTVLRHALVAALALTAGSCARDSVAALDVSIGSSTRLLVLAPHPADEALAAAGLIHYADWPLTEDA